MVYHHSMQTPNAATNTSSVSALAQEARSVVSIAEARHGILRLADTTFAKEAHIRPEVQEKAEEITTEFKQKSAGVLRKALDDWLNSASVESAGTPDFLQPSSEARTEIGRLHTVAEKRVFDLLTPQEQAHWRDDKPVQATPSRLLKQRGVAIVE